MPLLPTKEVLAMLACPACRGELRNDRTTVRCTACSRQYPLVDGIPVLLVERALIAAPSGDSAASREPDHD